MTTDLERGLVDLCHTSTPTLGGAAPVVFQGVVYETPSSEKLSYPTISVVNRKYHMYLSDLSLFFCFRFDFFCPPLNFCFLLSFLWKYGTFSRTGHIT